ncbi:MAG TPA: hypothetical protein VGH23_13925 [Rhizomicrobium sp.]|jgi:hypothetical protein
MLLGLMLLAIPALAAPVGSAVVNSVAALQALGAASAATPAIHVQSYYEGAGRGGGLFIWDAARNDPADGCTVFATLGVAQGRWTRQFSGPLNAAMCGAYWDGKHDDALALNNALKVAASLHTSLDLPGGVGKVCSTVTAAPGVVVRGQGMGTAGAVAASPTFIDANCMKAGWVFEFLAPRSSVNYEAPKYYDMSIRNGLSNAMGGCIRWNSRDGGFADNASVQAALMHPHAERVYCEMNNVVSNQQIGFQCNKCFDGDISQSETMFGRNGIALEGSDIMCIGCAGANRLAGANGPLIVINRHNTFGNKDRVVGNEILTPADFGQSYDAFIYDSTRSSTIEANHIEGAIKGGRSAIHLDGGSHAVRDNDIEVYTEGSRSVPHWLVVNGPFTTLEISGNTCFGCVLNPVLFDSRLSQPNYNFPGAREIISHGGNANNGDFGFPGGTNGRN